jgi:hypothetical protein
MAANLSWYPMDAKAGTNLQQRQTIASTSTSIPNLGGQIGYEVPAPTMNLGDRVQGNNDSLWVFVQASTTVTAGNAVTWGEAFNANNATQALAGLGRPIGIAQFYVAGQGPGSIQSTLTQDAAQPGDYFWAAIQGVGLVANISATSGTNVQLYLTANATTDVWSNIPMAASL